MAVKYHIQGKIPEKDFILMRQENKKIYQTQELNDWTDEIQIRFADAPGWVSYSETEYGVYTPLQIRLEIHTPRKTNLIKQIKATLDAFENVAYVKDCTVVDITAERIADNEEYADMYVRPMNAENINLPDDDYIPLDRYIGPIKNSSFDIKGYPLSKDDLEKDEELKEWIRQEFAAEKKIDGDFEMTLQISTHDVGVEMELTERLEKWHWERFPVKRPDLDNCAFTIINALDGVLYDSPEQISKLHILKTYYNPIMFRNRVWIQ